MFKKKYLKYIIIATLLCYGLFVFVIIPQQRDNDKCKEFVINISGNRLGTINNDEIVDILTNEGLYPKGKAMESISCLKIENFVKAISLVKECQVYKTNDNRMKMELVCREPVIKVYDKEGTNYYVDIDGKKITDIKKPLLLPVVSGEVDDSMLGYELKSIVKAIENDPFWLAQIEQIYFNSEKEIIITPKMGNHIIEAGTVKMLEKKLHSLKVFYTEALNTVGWDKYSKLNVKISNKVICTKREK